jgi:hemerythrin superfamily protein
MPRPMEMLHDDHEKVKQLFEQFEESESDEKKELVTTAIQELEIHTALEEEIFYPAARQALEENSEDTETMDEAWEEHHVVKMIIAELKKMRPNDEHYDAKFKVMAESVKHHIKEEEGELFPKLQGNLDEEEELGERMMERKEKLQQHPPSASRATGSRGRSTRRKRRQSSGRKSRRKAAGGRR